MELFKLLPFFGPLFGFAIGWLFVRHTNLRNAAQESNDLACTRSNHVPSTSVCSLFDFPITG